MSTIIVASAVHDAIQGGHSSSWLRLRYVSAQGIAMLASLEAPGTFSCRLA